VSESERPRGQKENICEREMDRKRYIVSYIGVREKKEKRKWGERARAKDR
jgi:hypothetical protein